MSELVGRTLELLAESKDAFASAVKNIFDRKTMATLKISDLSVGDWLYHDDIVFGREIAEVHRLNKDENGETIGITVYRSDGAFGVVGYIWTSLTQGDLRPIPITAEILEKNGFENMGSGLMRYEFELREKKYKIILGSLDEEVWFADFYFMRKKNINSNIPLFYIHQLQHILRLAGVEKEINLSTT